ncbi:MAG TPA: histidine kinase, partial [Streptosporangiaceae bacterium]
TPSGEHLSIETAVGAGADGALGLVFPLRTAMSRFVFASGKPMAVRDFSSDERVARLPQRMIPLGPAVIFPLGLPGEVRGVMTAGQKIGAPPLAQPVVEMLSTFAVQAGIGLRLAGLRHDAERAALLADRDRIARDLHDLVIQRLFATGMSLHGALPLLEPGTAADRVRRAVDDLDETIRDIRSAIFTLVPGDRQDAPLLRARIVSVAEEMSGPLGFAPWLRIDGALDARVPRQASDDLLAALREGLANVARHARASEADVTVTAGRDLLLAVRDNGRGIRKGGRRSGLANLARRAAGLGGALAVTPADGGGTLLSWRIPLDGSAPRLSHPGHPARPAPRRHRPAPAAASYPPLAARRRELARMLADQQLYLPGHEARRVRPQPEAAPCPAGRGRRDARLARPAGDQHHRRLAAQLGQVRHHGEQLGLGPEQLPVQHRRAEPDAGRDRAADVLLALRGDDRQPARHQQPGQCPGRLPRHRSRLGEQDRVLVVLHGRDSFTGNRHGKTTLRNRGDRRGCLLPATR